VVILSSQEYSVGDLWPKKAKDLGDFVEKRLTEKVAGAFTGTSWNSEIESQKSDSDSESVSTDILPGNPEDDVAVIPVEDTAASMISISEEELEATVNSSRLEGENSVKQRLEDLYESKIQESKDGQKAFFEAIENNLNFSSEFTSQLSQLALALGEIIARSELTNNRDVIERFLSTAINQVAEESQVTATFSIAEEWRELIKELDMESNYPNYRFNFDRTLKPGSVSVIFGNGGFEDTIDQRIAELSQQILNYAPSNNNLLTLPNLSNINSSPDIDTEGASPDDSTLSVTEESQDADAIDASLSATEEGQDADAIDASLSDTEEGQDADAIDTSLSATEEGQDSSAIDSPDDSDNETDPNE
jgi:flagellar biosynthesis/type III secretory pathway protein FliH